MVERHLVLAFETYLPLELRRSSFFDDSVTR